MKERNTPVKAESGKRHYDDACASTHAMEILGGRWALPVMRELMFGPRRFGDIRASIPGISANVLTLRLEELEAVGVAQRRKLPPPASVQVYELTPWGYEAAPIFAALGRWGARSPGHDRSQPLSAVSLILSFRTMLDPARAANFTGRLGFELGEQTFLFAIEKGVVTIAHDIAGADATFAGSPSALAAAAHGGKPLATLEAEGAVRVKGNRTLAKKFLTLMLDPRRLPDVARGRG